MPPADSELEVACFETRVQALPWEILHQHFGHISYSGLEKLVQLDLIDRLQADMKSLKLDCIPCVKVQWP